MKDYVKKWESRCYFDEIPDEAPRKLEDSGRVPSYRRIAIAILNNDLCFHSLGFERRESETSENLMDIKRKEKSGQFPLI